MNRFEMSQDGSSFLVIFINCIKKKNIQSKLNFCLPVDILGINW